jgi:hypothetical protein
MSQIFDALWRALAYGLHPRVIGLSLLPLGLMLVASLLFVYLGWEGSVAAVQGWLASLGWYQWLAGWLADMGWPRAAGMMAPLVVLALAMPVIVVACLLLVAAFMTSAMATLVRERRFPALVPRHGASLLRAVAWSLWSTLVALVVLVLTVPLWLIPPLYLVLPPLIWGWLTYRVFAFDALADHASAAERERLLREHRGNLLVMGVLTGYLGAAPSLLWASGALSLVLAPVLVPLAIWVYTLVFALSSLWFAHYLLAALQRLRDAEAPADARPVAVAQRAPITPTPALPGDTGTGADAREARG